MPERYQLEEYMDMYDGKVVLCGANSYEEKYYLNPDFEQLPDDVKNELKIMCVLYVHDVGGLKKTENYALRYRPRNSIRCSMRSEASLRSSSCRERNRIFCRHCSYIIKYSSWVKR